MKGVDLSFEECRKEMADQMTSELNNSSQKEITVQSRGNDVQDFLSALDEFESTSRGCDIVIA